MGSTAYTISGASEFGEVRYRAFGANRFTSGTTPTTYRYTGQREESALGLYYYGARWYDPALGHFIQPDTTVPEPGNVLDYHRYAYVRYNPLKYVDPSGHCLALAARAESVRMLADCLSGGGGAGVPLSRGEKAALSATTGLGIAAALNAGLAAGSPPSQADAVAPLLETLPRQALQEGAITTSIPLGGSDTLSSPVIQPLTAPVGSQVPSVLAEPLPVVDPRGHVYLSNREREILSLQRAIRSFEKRLTEHKEKLATYIQNPYASDNKELLINAPTEEIRQHIIQRRIEKLQAQIEGFRNDIARAQERLRNLQEE